MMTEGRETLLAELRRLQQKAEHAEAEAAAYIASQPEAMREPFMVRAMELGWLKGTLREIAMGMEIILVQLAADHAKQARPARRRAA